MATGNDGVNRDMLNALQRAIDSREEWADRIDAANPGDNYASLMVREDIDQLKALKHALTGGAQPSDMDHGNSMNVEVSDGVRPVEAPSQKPTHICPKCKVDRFKQDCPGPRSDCPMVATALGVRVSPSGGVWVEWEHPCSERGEPVLTTKGRRCRFCGTTEENTTDGVDTSRGGEQ